MGYIESGKQEGATLLSGGSRLGKEGYFIEPTIFTDVKSDMKIVREEIFGPVAVIAKFKDEAELIEMANDTVYGLASAVYTQNINRAIRVANALETGGVWVSLHSVHHAKRFISWLTGLWYRSTRLPCPISRCHSVV